MLRNFRFANAATAAALLGLSWLTVAPARAGSYTYNSDERTINAGILILQTQPTAPQPALDLPNYDPYPFYVLNQRADIKPAGWSIVNPMAPKIVDANIIARWDAAASTIPGQSLRHYGGQGHAYTIGLPVTQNMGAVLGDVRLDVVDHNRRYAAVQRFGARYP